MNVSLLIDWSREEGPSSPLSDSCPGSVGVGSNSVSACEDSVGLELRGIAVVVLGLVGVVDIAVGIVVVVVCVEVDMVVEGGIEMVLDAAVDAVEGGVTEVVDVGVD